MIRNFTRKEIERGIVEMGFHNWLEFIVAVIALVFIVYFGLIGISILAIDPTCMVQ